MGGLAEPVFALSVSLHVKIGLIVSVCISKGEQCDLQTEEYAYFLHTTQDRCQNMWRCVTDYSWLKGDIEDCDDHEEAGLAVLPMETVPFSLDQTLSSWNECQSKKVPESAFRLYHHLM